MIDSSFWGGGGLFAYRGIFRARAREVHQYLRQTSTTRTLTGSLRRHSDSRAFVPGSAVAESFPVPNPPSAVGVSFAFGRRGCCPIWRAMGPEPFGVVGPSSTRTSGSDEGRQGVHKALLHPAVR